MIVPALDVAGLIPLTPGNFGVTSGAIAMALQAHGMSFTNGLAAGIAFRPMTGDGDTEGAARGRSVLAARRRSWSTM